MDQSLEFIIWADRHLEDKNRIIEATSKHIKNDIVVDRHKLSFDPDSGYVTVTRASDDVPFACKICGCKLTYELLLRLLNGVRDDLTGMEWL